jgi:hypothetical protein
MTFGSLKVGKRTEEERRFSENIDRLLAGEKARIGEDMDEEQRTAIDLARKLIEFRDTPSPHFKDHLKRQLLLKLAEQEGVARRERQRTNRFRKALGNLIPQNPAWRAAIATVAVAVLAVIVLWGSGTLTPTPQQNGQLMEMAPTLGKSFTAPEVIEITASEMTLAPFGDSFKVDLTFRNVSPESVEVAPFPPAFQITMADSGGVIRSLEAGNERREILPSGTLAFTLVWDQRDDNGKQAAPGRYSIAIIDFTVYQAAAPEGTHLPFTLVTEIVIQSP